MKVAGFIVVLAITLAAIVVLAGQLGFYAGNAPADIGVHNGRLKPPSITPNSVSSQADLYPDHPQRSSAGIAPFTFKGDADLALQKLAIILQRFGRTTVVEQRADYLYAQCITPLMNFTDDVEFWLDRNANLIHVRSASRLGKGDMGANRARIEKIRARFQEN